MRTRVDEHGKVLNEDMFSPDVPGCRGSRNSYTYGFEYRIVPLEAPTIKKLRNDRKVGRCRDYDDKVFVGMDVSGYSGDTNRMHRGRVVNLEFEEDGITYKHIVIIDQETNREVRLLPNAIEIHLPPLHPDPHVRQEDGDGPIENKWENLWDKCNEAEVSVFSGNDDGDEELSWDEIHDDELYREMIVSEYGIEPEVERYWNEKFTNKELFKVNRFELTAIESPALLAEMWGYEYPDLKVPVGVSVRRMLQYYLALSGQPYVKRIDVSLKNYKIEILKSEIYVSSWKQIWQLVQSIKSVHRLRIRTAEFKPDNSAGNLWNLDTRTYGYKSMIRQWLCYNLRMVPEWMCVDGKTTTMVNHFKYVNQILDKYCKL